MQSKEFDAWKALLSAEKAEDEAVAACADADFNAPVSDVINLLRGNGSAEEIFLAEIGA